MRTNHILHGVGLTLVGTLCLSMCSAAQQTQSSSFKQLVPQIATDAIGFDSGLWRSEYLQQLTQDDDDDDTKPSTSTIMTSAKTAASAATSGSAKSPPPAFVYSDKLVTIPLDIPAMIETPMQHANGESSLLMEETAMSEWENAVAESGGSVTPGSTASGPSVTSAIVGFVGIMIVIGAYVSSGKRNR